MVELGGEVQGARSDWYFGFIGEWGKFEKITDASKITAGEGLEITKTDGKQILRFVSALVRLLRNL